MARSKSVQEQVIDITAFKGINTYFRPFSLPPEYLFFALNIDFTENGKIEQRAGTHVIQKFDNQPNLFACKFVNAGEKVEKLVCIENTNFWVYDETNKNFTNLKSNLDANSVWGGVVYVDKFLFGNGATNYVYKISDNSISAVTVNNKTNHNSSTGTIWEIFASRVWAAGDKTEDLYYSAVGDPTTWNTTDFIAFDGVIKAIKAVGQFLFVGTDNAIYRVISTGDSNIPFKVEKMLNVGCVANGIFGLKGSVVGIIGNDGKVYTFDPYIQSGSQIDDSIALPIFNVIKAINDESKISVNRVFNKIYLATNFENVPIMDHIGTVVLNENTFGWSFYNPKFYDWCEYNGKIYCVDNNYVRLLDAKSYQDEYLDDSGNIVSQDFETYIVTSVLGGSAPEYSKSWRYLYLTVVSMTKTLYKFYCAVNFAEYFKDWDSQSYYASDAYLGFERVGEFILGGSYGQIGKIRLDANTNGLMLKIEKGSSDSDFQIGRLKVSFYPSYRR